MKKNFLAKLAWLSVVLGLASAAEATQTYYWKGGAGASWGILSNWKVGADEATAVDATVTPTLGTDTISIGDNSVVALTNYMAYTETNLTLGNNVTFVCPSKGITMGLQSSSQTLNQNVTIQGGKVTIAAATTISGNATITYRNCSISHTSSSNATLNPNKLIFDDVQLTNGSSSKKGYLYIKCPVQFEENVTNTFTAAHANGRIGFENTITGGGLVRFTPSAGQIYASGDWSSFTGRVDVVATGDGTSLYFSDNGTNFVDSSWNIYTNSTTPKYTGGSAQNGEYWLFRYTNKTVLFGSLNAYIPYHNGISKYTDPKHTNNTIKLGYFDEDNFLAGGFGEAASTAKYTFEWVAPTNTLTFSTSNTYAIVVSGGGKLHFANPDGTATTNGIPTSLSFTGNGGYLVCDNDDTFTAATNVIKNSTGPLGFDVPSGNRTVDLNKLPSGNSVSALMKKGLGTLTLETAPNWTTAQKITVHDGQLVINDTSFTNYDLTDTNTRVDTVGSTLVFSPTAQATVTFTSANIVVSTNGTAIATGDKVTVGDTITIAPTAGYKITSAIMVNGTALEGNTYKVLSTDVAGGIEIAATAQLIIAKIGTTDYFSFADAVSEAKSGETIVLQQNVTLESKLSIADGVTLSINGKTFDLNGYGVYYADGYHEIDTDGSKIYLKTAYVWTGKGNDNAWTNGLNWQKGGSDCGATDYPNDRTSCSADYTPTLQVVIPSDGASISISGEDNAHVGVVRLEGNLTLSGSAALYLTDCRGAGELKLDGSITISNYSYTYTTSGGKTAYAGSYADFNVPVEIAGDNVQFVLRAGSARMYDTVSGSGKVKVTDQNNGNSMKFYAGNTFEGIFTYYNKSYAHRGVTYFEDGASSSADARWVNIHGYEHLTEKANRNFGKNDETYYFGSLENCNLQMIFCTGVTLEIGNRSDVSSYIKGNMGNANSSNGVTKVGSSTLRIDNTNVHHIEAREGTVLLGKIDAVPYGWLKFTGGTLMCAQDTTNLIKTVDSVVTTNKFNFMIDPSAAISNSTAAIVFDDQGTNRTWATAIAASNVAGFTKKGSGTLTLSAAPLWTAENKETEVITVEDGSLVVNDTTFENYTLGQNTVVETVGSTLVFSHIARATVTFTSEHVVVSTNGVAIASGDKVTVGDTITIMPETGYTIPSSILVNDTAIDGNTYTLTGADSMTIAATAVSILYWNGSATNDKAWWAENAWDDAKGDKVAYSSDDNDGTRSTVLPDIDASEVSIDTYLDKNTDLQPASINVTATRTKYTLTAGSKSLKPSLVTLEANSYLSLEITKTGGIDVHTLYVKSGAQVRFLASTGNSVVTTANLSNGAILDLDISGNNSYTVPTFTTTILDTDAVVSVIAASTIADGDVILNWTTAPTTGSFVLSDETLRSQFKLVVTGTGLEVQARSSEEDLEEKQISVAEENTVAIDGGLVGSVITNVDISITTPFALTGHGGFVMTNKVDGTANKLTVSEGGILVLNPPRCPVRLATAPVLSGKLALASEYRHNTIGKFTLMTWDDGAALGLPTDLDAVFTNTTMATSFDLYVTNATWVSGTAKSLVLTLGNYATDKTPLKLMPLGDSITEGVPKDSGQLAPTYRLPLAAKLTAAGYDVTTVGWRRTSTNDATDISSPFEWCYHSGKEGEKLTWTASTTARGAIQESLEAMLDQAGVPDVITFMIGTNDLGYEKDRFTAAEYEEALTNVLWRIYNYRPTTKVVLSTLLDLNIGGSTYDPQVASNCVKVVRGLFADGNAYGFPEHFLYLNDAYDQVPRKVNGVYQGNFLKSGNVHPNFVGHDKFSDTWFVAVTNALADAAAEGSVTVNTGVGAEANVPEAYRSAFTKIATYTVDTNKQYSATSPVTYTIVDEAKTNHIARIAYYLELKRVGSEHRRFVWVDMNAFNDRTLVGMGIPTGYEKWGRVTNLHVCSNDPAVHNIAANDNDEQGWLQFTLKRSGVAATNLVTSVDGNPGCFDCNDVIDASKNGGVMQVYRLLDEKPWYRPPAELVFAFGGWANDKKYARQIGIGNFAQHAISGSTPSINYYNVNNETMGASAYEVMNFEIWAVQQTADEQAADDYTWTGGGDGRLWTDIVNWGNVNMYPGYGEGDRAIFDRNYSPANVELNQDLSISNFVMNGGIETTSNILVLASTDHHTLTITGTNGSVRAEDYCALTITNLKFSVTGDLSTLGSGQQDNNSIVRLEAGNEFTGSYLFVNGTNSYLYVDGGTYTLSKEVRLQNGGHFIITGGTVTTPTILTKYSSGYSDSGCTADFDGGSFTSKNSSVSNVAITVLPTATLKFTSANGAKNFAEAVTPAAKTIDMGGTAVDVTKYYKGLVDSENKITGYTLRTSGENSVMPSNTVGTVMSSATNSVGATIGVTVTNPANVKKGFYYRLASSASLDGGFDDDKCGDFVQATSDGAALTLSNTNNAAKVLYYKVQVSDTAP